ncbi:MULTISPECIES: hypothetical protein [Olivibacter]|jgi:hypothetical protein|uniref:Uncharacterized protein n=2 Tax=Olivibacter TaxID=376469 RepID=A0ABV6HH80_9SPHI|nr:MULTISPECIES: hypothetical protein [Olivibacter]MDX3912985.1 hypothetical protein [Pseudosphingobacterium sp.]QEL00670.1 hypothetical protein FKG96_07545 [Olivibacter sp. LS-1]
MIVTLTPDIVQQLHAKGITFLYAPLQFSLDDPIWVPMVVEFFDCDWIDPQADAVLLLKAALEIPFEQFLNHRVMLPNNWDMHVV